jgi:hypothetical protein
MGWAVRVMICTPVFLGLRPLGPLVTGLGTMYGRVRGLSVLYGLFFIVLTMFVGNLPHVLLKEHDALL